MKKVRKKKYFFFLKSLDIIFQEFNVSISSQSHGYYVKPFYMHNAGCHCRKTHKKGRKKMLKERHDIQQLAHSNKKYKRQQQQKYFHSASLPKSGKDHFKLKDNKKKKTYKPHLRQLSKRNI